MNSNIDPMLEADKSIEFAGQNIQLDKLVALFKEKHDQAGKQYGLFIKICQAIDVAWNSYQKKKVELLNNYKKNDDIVSDNRQLLSQCKLEFIQNPDNQKLFKDLSTQYIDEEDFKGHPEAYLIFLQLSMLNRKAADTNKPIPVYDKNSLNKDLKIKIAFEAFMVGDYPALNNLLAADNAFECVAENKILSLFVHKKNLTKYLTPENIDRLYKIYLEIQHLTFETLQQWCKEKKADPNFVIFSKWLDQDKTINPNKMKKYSDNHDEDNKNLARVKSKLVDLLCELTGISIESQAMQYRQPITFNDREEVTNEQKLMRHYFRNYASPTPLSINCLLDICVVYQDFKPVLDDVSTLNKHHESIDIKNKMVRALAEGDDQSLQAMLEQDIPAAFKFKPIAMGRGEDTNSMMVYACKFGTVYAVNQLLEEGFKFEENQSKTDALRQAAAQCAFYNNNSVFSDLMDNHKEIILHGGDQHHLHYPRDKKLANQLKVFDAKTYNKHLNNYKHPQDIFTHAIDGKNHLVVKALLKKALFTATEHHVLLALTRNDGKTLHALLTSNPRLLTTTFKDGLFNIPLLHIACRFSYDKAVEVLLDFNVDPDQRAGGTRQTPLMRAARAGNRDICNLLINKGANPLLTNTLGKKASDIANDMYEKLCKQKSKAYLNSESDYTRRNRKRNMDRYQNLRETLLRDEKEAKKNEKQTTFTPKK